MDLKVVSTNEFVDPDHVDRHQIYFVVLADKNGSNDEFVITYVSRSTDQGLQVLRVIDDGYESLCSYAGNQTADDLFDILQHRADTIAKHYFEELTA